MGHAVSGIGSYISGSAYAEIYSNNFSTFPEWKGNNATISRIGEAIAGTTSHEIGHLLNLYHAYMFDSFGPTITGALTEYYQPNHEGLLPAECTTDPNKHYHLMATSVYITGEQMATINRYFSANSSQILNIAKNGGYNITRNTTWGIGGKNFYQENDIIINSDKTLILASGGYVHHLNGKLIKGGTIEKYGSVNNDYIQLKSGYILKGLFSTIHSAINSAVSGQIIEVYSSHILTENCTVPPGVTLDIKSNASININGKYINCSGSGKIIKNGSVTNYSHYAKSGNDYKGFFPSTTSIQQIINWASSGWDIYVGSGTYTGNLAMKANVDLNGYPNLPIINGTITLNNDDNVRIENLKVKNKILITNSDNVYLNIRSDHPNCYVEAVNSDIYLYDPYFFQSQAKAFYGHDNGHSDFFKGSFRNKTSQGTYLHYWATAEFTESIFCSNVFDINATGMCYAAINNYGYFSGSQYRSTVTSAVSVTPYQWYYCGSSALAKSTEEPTEPDDIKEIVSAHTEFETAMNEYRIIKSYIREDLKTDSEINPSKYKLDYENTIDAFKEVVEKYPTSTEAILSLDKISSSYRALGEYDNLMNYNNSISNNKNYNVLRPHALNIEKQTFTKQGAYTKALELSDRIIKEYPNHELVVELIYSKGLIYNYYLNDKDKAAEMFKEVIAKYPKEMTAQSAREELENLGIEFEVKKQILTERTNIFNVESYPNPFNPSTTISYSLPSDANVKVVIYDIMGRVVNTLTSETQLSGSHQVIWDGTNLNGARVSSGI